MAGFPQLAWVRNGSMHFTLTAQIREIQMLTNEGLVPPYVQLFEIAPEHVGKTVDELSKLYPCTLVHGEMIQEKVKKRDAPDGAPVAPAAG